MNCLKLKRFSHHLQVSFTRFVVLGNKLYAPNSLKHRRNTDQIKLS
ncbi:IS982 family transposase, partial [Lactobacillus helveticus]|nr:IS982 family transposase [Lactobacillus helveticus]